MTLDGVQVDPLTGILTACPERSLPEREGSSTFVQRVLRYMVRPTPWLPGASSTAMASDIAFRVFMSRSCMDHGQALTTAVP